MVKYYTIFSGIEDKRDAPNLARFDAILTGLFIISNKALSINSITNWCALAQLTPYE